VWPRRARHGWRARRRGMGAVPGRSTQSLDSNMRYAGFWPRLGAIVVDTVVLIPIIALSFWSFSSSRAVALSFELPIAALFPLYNIYFIARWGQTLGKMALGIRVVALDGAPAGYRRALLRHSVDLVFALATSVLTLFALATTTSQEFEAMSLDARLELLAAKTGSLNDFVNWLVLAWTASELVVLLFNEKRRAIHDYIAGTVVVHTRNVPVAV
jgi:uncharacterized RDD family membrane protein YckC